MIADYLLSIKYNEPEVYNKYPELDAYVKRVQAVPQIKGYIENRKYFIF
jgi:hypothetical protein